MEKEWINLSNLRAEHNCFEHLDCYHNCKVCGINVEEEYFRMKKQIQILEDEVAYESNMKNFYFLNHH